MKVNILLALAIVIMSACTKSKTEGTNTSNDLPGAISEPGYGDSQLPFKATAWHLPTGITIEDSIHEYSYCWAFPPYIQVAPKDWKGVPLGFTFCFTLKNNNTGPVIIQFPPQLVLTSSSLPYQNVLIISISTIELAHTESRTIVAQAFCINKGRDVPQTFVKDTEHFLSYSFGPSEVPAPLQEIVGIVSAKHIKMEDVLDANGRVDNDKTTKYFVIQKAIWEVTDGEGLTANTRNELLAL